MRVRASPSLTRHRFLLRGLALLALALVAEAVERRFSFVAPLDAARLPLTMYTTADGLPHDEVTTIVSDSRGFLWFGTLEGLARFDGYRFTTYTTRDGLDDAFIRDLVESRSGVYWIATDSAGVSRYDPGARGDRPRFKTFPLGRGARGDVEISALFEDREGNIWAASVGGLHRLDRGNLDGKFQPVDLGIAADEQTNLADLVEDGAGNLWIATTRGLRRRTPAGRVDLFRLRPGAGLDYAQVLLRDRQGRIWIGHQAGLAVVDPHAVAASEPAAPGSVLTFEDVRWYTTTNGLPDADVRALHQSTDGRLWIGTRRGLAVFDGVAIRRYSGDRTLDTAINAVVEDRDGNIWAAPRGGGAIRISPRGFLSYGVEDGLANPAIVSVFETRAGDLVAVAAQWTISRFDGDRFTSFHPNLPAGLLASSTLRWAIIQDHLGEWWVATGRGLYRFPKVERLEDLARAVPKAVYTTRDGLADDYISRLFEDSRGDIWISSFHPPVMLTRWERATGRFHRYGVGDGLPDDNWANAFAEDQAGHVWLGLHNGGLARYRGRLEARDRSGTPARPRDGRFEVFGAGEGVPVGLTQGLYVDRQGRLWIAVRSAKGTGRIDDPGTARPRALPFAAAGALSSDNLRCFVEDSHGRIYIGTARGISRLDPATGQVTYLGVADGLAASEVWAAYRDRRGALWFGTSRGLSRLVEQPAATVAPPPAVISAVRIAGVPHPISEIGDTDLGHLDLEARQDQIQFDFFAVNFSAAGALRYQYMIEGVDPDWSAPTDQRSVAARLVPGRYRFLVRSVRNGVPSPRPAVVSFSIAPPFWRRGWVLALAAAAAAALAVFAAQRYRVARLLELERIRLRIATDLHDDIGSSLSQIAILSELALQQAGSNGWPVREALSRIASTSRELVDAMSDIVWAISPRRDHLEDLVQRMRRFGSDTFAPGDIEFRFTGPKAPSDLRLGADVRRQVYLVFKEAVANAVRHAACSAADVTVAREKDQLVLIISDNGRGFDQSRSRQGHGLLSMIQRAKALGGALDVDSQPGRGTRVTLKVPIRGQRLRSP